MYRTKFLFLILLQAGMLGLTSCNETKKTSPNETYSDIEIVGAMKNVMWKGKLEGSVNLDTISDKSGLYGLGPQSYLTGELLIIEGKTYLSKVTSDSTMSVENTSNVTAPFFVYGNVTQWEEIKLPSSVKTIKDLEQFIDEKTKSFKRPFAFKLTGMVDKATIHIQNLPEGTKVSSPTEAHQGQTNYELINEPSEIVGFFSTQHKGVFTHHDSFLHMHLINKDRSKMGHLDTLAIGEMSLFLPKN